VAGEGLDLDPLAPEPGERGVDLVPALEAQPLRAGEETLEAGLADLLGCRLDVDGELA
jgi:hypothetical protein